MRNILVCFCILLLATNTWAQDSSFLLQGNIEGFKKGLIYLNYRNSRNAGVLDSALVIKGSFSITGKITEPTRVYLYSSAKTRNDSEGANETDFFLEPTVMKVQLAHGKFSQARLSGSKTQDEWIDYQRKTEIFEVKWQSVLSAIKKTETEKNWGLVDSLRDRYIRQYKEGNQQLYSDFVHANPESFISVDLLSLNRHRLPFDSLNLFYQHLAPIVKQTREGISLGEFIVKEGSLQIGKQVPEITFTDKEGVSRKLSDFKGKFILLDFWASWCVPCRQENPYLVDAYRKYKTKGFEIVSFSLDREKEKQEWLDAIVQDSMNWIQVCDFKYWNSEITIAFNLFGRGIPVNFLLDAEGKIIGRDLRAGKLEEYLLRYMR